MDQELDARLAAMRRSYEGGSLGEEDLAGTWLQQFERWLADAIAAELPEPNAMTLATADAAGRPSARTVLLRSVDERGFACFTNLGSRKAREAAENPWAALTFAWIPLQRQITVRGEITPVDAAESDAYFATRPHGHQIAATASAQSQVLGSRAELEERVAELVVRWPEGTDVPRPERWGGLRLDPHEVEFWQGRRNRLHDRLRFRRVSHHDWVVERLAP